MIYYCGPLRLDKQRQDDQLEPTYYSSSPIRDVALKTCRKQWTIGRLGERGSGIPSLMVWHDDDDILPKEIISLDFFENVLLPIGNYFAWIRFIYWNIIDIQTRTHTNTNSLSRSLSLSLSHTHTHTYTHTHAYMCIFFLHVNFW